MPTRQPIPINEAEAVIDAFWDKDLAPLAAYRLTAADGPTAAKFAAPANRPAVLGPVGAEQVRATQAWCWLTFDWNRLPARSGRGGRRTRVLTFERELDVDVTGYDRLIVRLSCPPHAIVSVRAVFDGRSRVVFRDQPGHRGLREYEGRIRGRRLSNFRLEIATAQPGPAEAWLDWIGCARSRSRTAMLNRPPLFNPRWEGWLQPEGSKVEFAPRFGFFFGKAELARLRRKARSPLYRPLMDRLRQTAREAMAAPRTPEMQIGPLIGAGDNSTTLVRERDLATRSFHTDAPICALVGLIDRDPACLRFAARIVMSLAHNGTWAPHFMQEFPGTSWDQRGFPEAFAMAGVCLALDWAGAWITPQGEHLVRHAIATKGLPRVRTVFLQYDYMLNCNQSHMIALGRLLGLLVLERAWPRTQADIDVFERDLFEIIDRYIQADGSTDEGLHYWNSTFRTNLPALVALARFRGRKLDDLVPAKVRAMDAFMASLLSTTGEPGAYLPIADTVADSLSVDAIVMMAAATGSPFWRGLTADCLRRGKLPKAERWSCDGPMAVIHGPERCPATPVRIPVFSRLAKAGHVSSCRRFAGGQLRLFLVGAMANAGHSHRDKGSFILEAAGETFLLDRGMVPYHDSDNLPFLKSEAAHNLAVPEGCQQQNPSTVASSWRGQGDVRRLTAMIETTGTWQAPVRSCTRTLRSPRPGLIEITDTFELAETRPVHFFLHTPLPVARVDDAWRIRGKTLDLFVRSPWAVQRSAGPCGVNWRYAPVNRIDLATAPAKRHRLVTVLELVPRG